MIFILMLLDPYNRTPYVLVEQNGLYGLLSIEMFNDYGKRDDKFNLFAKYDSIYAITDFYSKAKIDNEYLFIGFSHGYHMDYDIEFSLKE